MINYSELLALAIRLPIISWFHWIFGPLVQNLVGGLQFCKFQAPMTFAKCPDFKTVDNSVTIMAINSFLAGMNHPRVASQSRYK